MLQQELARQEQPQGVELPSPPAGGVSPLPSPSTGGVSSPSPSPSSGVSSGGGSWPISRAQERGIEVTPDLMDQLAGSVIRAQAKGATNILAMDADKVLYPGLWRVRARQS